MNIHQGLDFILSHFDDQESNIFPRTISTLQTQNKQVTIHSKAEALEYFKKSDYIDCRVSAFGENEQQLHKPNLIFVDLDDKTAKNEALALFHKTINGIPTVIDTGNGLAIIQPIHMNPWINATFKDKHSEELTKIFLSWVAQYLTNSKADSGNHPSLKSCLIRVPGSYNSKLLKNGMQKPVTILCEWNKIRPNVKELPFRNYLTSLIKHENRYRKHKPYKTGTLQYIEDILNRESITDGRQRFFALILCPYLMNIKKLSIQEANCEINRYFGEYIPKQLITYTLHQVKRKGILPYNLSKMKVNDTELYNIITKPQKVTNHA